MDNVCHDINDFTQTVARITQTYKYNKNNRDLRKYMTTHFGPDTGYHHTERLYRPTVPSLAICAWLLLNKLYV